MRPISTVCGLMVSLIRRTASLLYQDLLRPERLEIGTDSAEAILYAGVRGPCGQLVFDRYFVTLRPYPRRQESGRLCPPVGIISTTRPVVISQRHVDMKRFTRTGQRHIEDASLFFETF